MDRPAEASNKTVSSSQSGASYSQSPSLQSQQTRSGSSVSWQDEDEAAVAARQSEDYSSPSYQSGLSDSSSLISMRRSTSSSGDKYLSKSSSSTSKGSSGSSRKSLRRYKDGSKVFVGFQEDNEDLKPNDDMLPPMTWEEKCEIIEELCGALEKRLERVKNEKNDVLDGLKNLLDVANYNINTARKDRHELHRNVLQFAELLNPSGKPYTEDMSRFLTGRNISKRMIKEKLQARNQRLQNSITELTEQLDKKVDIRDILNESDISELKRLNTDLGNQVAGRHTIVVKSRIRTRNIILQQQKMRQTLQEEIQKNVNVKRDLADRTPMIKRFKEQVHGEKKERERINMEYLTAAKGENLLLPNVLDYMKLRQRSKDMRRELRTWLAKVEIAELARNQLTRHLACLQEEPVTVSS